jgi:undecaprenyl-diphosphatase
MEARLVVWIHEHANPWLDALFVLTHVLGDEPFVSSLVVISVAWHLARRRHRLAFLWLALGLTTVAILLLAKPWILRARPDFWPPIIGAQGGASFPSGHAIASATFYPLIAYEVAKGFPRFSRLAWVCAAVLSGLIGIGRVYLGVHWPTDVLAGWAVGAAQTLLGVAWLNRAVSKRRARS